MYQPKETKAQRKAANRKRRAEIEARNKLARELALPVDDPEDRSMMQAPRKGQRARHFTFKDSSR